MKTIKLMYHINSSVEKVWQALVDSELIERWGGGPAEMDDQEGTEFSLWGGDIHGVNKEVIVESTLVQEWFGGKWDKPSIVTFNLHKEEDGTRVELVQEHIPDREVHDIEQGWTDYYMDPLTKFVENS